MLTIISFIAIFTSTVSLIPQIYLSYKKKSVEDLSLLMLLNFLICSISWVAYSVFTDSFSVFISNLIMIIFSAVLLFFKFKFKKGKISNG